MAAWRGGQCAVVRRRPRARQATWWAGWQRGRHVVDTTFHRRNWPDLDVALASTCPPADRQDNQPSQSVNQASNQTHIHTQPFNGLLSGTNRVGWYQKKQSHPSWSSDIPYRLPPLLQSVVSSLFSLHAWQSLSTTSLQVLWSSSWSWTLYFILHAFLQPIINSSSSFRSTLPYYCSTWPYKASNRSLKWHSRRNQGIISK